MGGRVAGIGPMSTSSININSVSNISIGVVAGLLRPRYNSSIIKTYINPIFTIITTYILPLITITATNIDPIIYMTTTSHTLIFLNIIVNRMSKN